MGLGLAAFAAGLGSGYTNAQRYAAEKDRQAKLDQITLADAQWNQDQRQRQTDLQNALQTAGQSTSVTPGATMEGLSTPGNAAQYQDADLASADQRQSKTMAAATDTDAPDTTVTPKYGAGGQLYDTPALADAQVKTYNDPAARLARQSAAYDAAGRPADAISLQNASMTQQHTKFTMTKEQEERARQIRDEGLVDVATASRMGDPQSVYDAMNKTGKIKFTGVPTVTEKLRDDIPGKPAGTKTYDYTGEITDAQGNTRQGTFNSEDLSRDAMPYDKSYDLAVKGTGADSMAAYRSSLAGSREKTADATAQRAQTYADLKDFQKTGNLSREKRLQYQDLFNKASANIKPAQDALKALMDSRTFMLAAAKPDSPQAAELLNAQANVKRHQADYTLYQGFLANVGNPATGAGAPAPAAGGGFAPNGTAPGLGANGTGMTGDTQGQLDVMQHELNDPNTAEADKPAIQREMARIRATVPAASLGSVSLKGDAAAQQAGARVRVSTQAQRDALPKGTRYFDPQGNPMVRQ